MIPVALVTGFLGSGKTTLLENLIGQYKGRRIVYLVNEFSPLDVDGSRLHLPANELVSVSGGSIFCKCKVTDFIGSLRAIRQRSAGGGDFEGVVIEASGIANPKVIKQMFAETGMDEHYSLRSIVSVVDPGSFRKLIKTLPNIIAQVEAADKVLLNKIDLYDKAALEATRRELLNISPDLDIVETEYCRDSVDLFAFAKERELEGEYAKCVDPNYARSSVWIDRPVDWDKLKAAIDECGAFLYRAKGYLPVEGGFIYADYSPAGWSVKKSEARGKTGLALIVNGSEQGRMEELVRRIESGVFAA
ncbi:MAG: GTP-binding protein [Planctomycetes bacterium]|nr:GTP-binding protein [Planctomycetota bacterium]